MQFSRVFLALFVVLLANTALAAVNYYVSPAGGSDSNPGTISSPFATLEKAQTIIRALKTGGTFPSSGGITVWLRAGNYYRTSSFALASLDNGTAASPITYQAYAGEEARITGAKEIFGFSQVTDSTVLNRLSSAAKTSVLKSDLKAQGITDFGTIVRRGWNLPNPTAEMELFFNDEPMVLARYPNASDGFSAIAASPAPTASSFAYSGTRPSGWASLNDVWAQGFWNYDWADSYEQVSSIDTASHVVTLANSPNYGIKASQRFIFRNVLEELDSPGEYYIDRVNGIIYFWPPAPVAGAKITVSTLSVPLVTMTSTSFVNFRGIIFEGTRDKGISLTAGSANDSIKDCKVRNIGTAGIFAGVWNIGNNIAIDNCEIYNTGDDGIVLKGGNRQTLVPASNSVTNSDIHNVGRITLAESPAIKIIDSVGNLIAHNDIHDTPSSAVDIYNTGNDNIIEYNNIYRTNNSTADSGAIYIGRDWASRGNVFRYNYIHDLIRGPGVLDPNGVNGIYMDDQASGETVFGNILYNMENGVIIGGGRDITVQNNEFINIGIAPIGNCLAAICADQRGIRHVNDTVLNSNLTSVPYNQAPYTKYPHLAIILNDDPAYVKYDVVKSNIKYNSIKWIYYIQGAEAGIADANNFTNGDPLFVDFANKNFKIQPSSPAFLLGFEQIPTEQIGRQAGTCINDCASGQARCNGIVKQSCGNFDADSCLEWPLSTTGTGNENCAFGCSNGVCNTAPDTQAPSIPTGLAGSAVSSTQINISWNASTDNVGVAGYNFFRNGTKIASPTAASFTDSNLSQNNFYDYNVSAIDAANNESAKSAVIRIATLAACLDLTGDGKIDVFDLVFVALRIGNLAGDSADVKGNDGVNMQDLQEVAWHFGQNC